MNRLQSSCGTRLKCVEVKGFHSYKIVYSRLFLRCGHTRIQDRIASLTSIPLSLPQFLQRSDHLRLGIPAVRHASPPFRSLKSYSASCGFRGTGQLGMYGIEVSDKIESFDSQQVNLRGLQSRGHPPFKSVIKVTKPSPLHHNAPTLPVALVAHSAHTIPAQGLTLERNKGHSAAMKAPERGQADKSSGPSCRSQTQKV